MIRRLPIWALSLPIALILAGTGLYLSSSEPKPVSDAPELISGPRHPVTAEMWAESRKWQQAPSPDFEIRDTQGKEHSLATLTKDKPLFLYFVLDKCPCSIDAEPLFQRLEDHLEGRVQFVTVTSSSPERAKEWRANWGTSFPVIAMPGLELMKQFAVERSVYSVLIDKKQRIVKLWPGYNADMLRELSDAGFKLAGEKPKPFDPLYAPKEMTSGCEFEKA